MHEPDSQPSTSRREKSSEQAGGWGAATHWSLILEAQQSGSPQAAEALDQLCRAYWYPLYAYVRRWGYDSEEAQDLTQEFFARWLEKDALAGAAQCKGRFRSWLMVSLKNFLVNAQKSMHRQKRGGGRSLLSLDGDSAEERYCADLMSNLTPDKMFDRRWALMLLEHTMRELEAEQAQAGKGRQFAQLAVFLTADASEQNYTTTGAELGLSRDAVAMAVHRLRQRFRVLLRREIARTVNKPEDVDEELACLMATLRN